MAEDPEDSQSGASVKLPGVFSVPPDAPSEPPIAEGLLAKRYELGEEIGRGAAGVVHAGRDLRHDRPVAIKRLRDVEVRDGSLMDRLLREVELVRKLDHPAICEVLCLHAHEGRPFLAMERLEGPDLPAYLHGQGGRLPVERALALLRPIAGALDHAHARKVLHLDLKPGNLRFDRDPAEGGKLKVLDFGVARAAGSALAGRAGTGGTPAYRAPEQVRGETPRAAADVYGLAATLYELVGGVPPFLGKDVDRRVQEEAPRPLPGVSKAVNAALARGLAKDPGERPSSATAFLREVERANRPKVVLWVLLGLVVLVLVSLAMR